jgi:hypothetical protein
VLDDFLAINGPHIDAVQEVSAGGHGGVPFAAAKASEPRPGKGDKRGRGSELSEDVSGDDGESIKQYVLGLRNAINIGLTFAFRPTGFKVNGEQVLCVPA